jgi:GMP synthase-like glutamine amidotransferase
MRVHVLQHVPFEGLGSIEEWLHHQGASITYTRFFASNVLPSLDEVDFVIVLGGPMSVNDEDELPWLRTEKCFVADAINAEKAVLGICLGSQLIASSLGSRVYSGKHKEIGWFPIRAEPSVPNTFAFPKELVVFHWHGETFDLPPKATHLASSAGCRHQAFQLGDCVLGLQFHLETTPESADAIIANCRHELVQQKFVQSEAQLRSVTPDAYKEINKLMSQVLEYLARCVG